MEDRGWVKLGSAVTTERCSLRDAFNGNNNRFTALRPGLPGWAGTRRNIHPPTVLILVKSLSASSIYHDP